MNKIVAIFNPVCRGGRAMKNLPDLQAAVEKSIPQEFGQVDWRPTRRPGDASVRARDALEAGAEMLLSVGGDGTHGGIVNGYFQDNGEPINPYAKLGIIHLGMGGDLRKSLGVGPNVKDSLEVIAANRVRKIDAGKISYQSDAGEKAATYFLNIASAGIAGTVDRLVKSAIFKYLGGRAAFAEATFRSFFKYRNCPMRIELDGQPLATQTVCNLIVANGRFFGGGMKIAPDALLNDGMFDVICMGDFSVFDFIRHHSRLYDGSHLDLSKVWQERAKSVYIEADREIFLDIDGEPIGKLPAEISILPRKLNVLCGENAFLF